jgi:heme exporter protein D
MHISFEVDRYGPYIWPAFGLTALVLGGLIVQTLASAGRWRRQAERLQAQADARK